MKKFTKKIIKYSFFSLSFIGTVFATNGFSIYSDFHDKVSNAESKVFANTSLTSSPAVIDDFTDYNILYSSSDIAPVNTNQGMIGMTTNKQNLTLTTYDGILVWNKKFNELKEIKEYYKNKLNVDDISQYTINNYIYQPKNNILIILFGNSNNTNQIMFAVDFVTSNFFVPIKDEEFIVPVLDGVTNLYLNSSQNIIGISSGKKFVEYSTKSQLFSFDTKLGISQIDLKFNDFISTSAEDYFISLIQGINGKNIALFLKEANRSNSTKIYKYYWMLVDDYLQPILVGNDKKGGDVGEFSNLSNFYQGTSSSQQPSANDIDWNQIIKYQCGTEYVDKNNIYFFVVIPGEKSSVNKGCYHIPNNSFEWIWQKNIHSEGNYAYSYIFESKSEHLYISNKKSTKGISLMYLPMNANQNPNISILDTTTDSKYYDLNTHIYTKPFTIAPIISQVALSNPNPYLVIKEGENPIAKYFISSTEIFTTIIDFKSYSDPLPKIKASNEYNNSLPSSISNNRLLQFLEFTKPLSNINTKIINRKNNDDIGQLYFEYEVSYSNWYDKNTRTSFRIPIIVDGMYSKNEKYKFNFVTTLNGNQENDTKFKEVQKIISSKYVNQVTPKDIIDNFIIYDIKDVSNNKVTISEQDISLTPEDGGYGLNVSITIRNQNLPNGLKTNTFSHKYIGFKTAAGYEISYNDQSNDAQLLIKSIFPTEISLQDVLEKFVVLGNKWSRNSNDWEFTLSPNLYEGSAFISLKYKGTESDFPESSIGRTIINNKYITGFKSVASQFDKPINITNYSGGSLPSGLWRQYVNSPSNSLLLQSIQFPYISDNSFLEISNLNETTMDQDGYIDLSVKLKIGAKTNLSVPGSGNPYFVYDQQAEASFYAYFGDGYPFKVRWNISNIEQKFEWLSPTGEQTNTGNDMYLVDLEKINYEGINKEMYANDVKEEYIDNLFEYEHYTVTKTMIPNNDKGSLKVILVLQSLVNSGSGNDIIKTINIINFKVPKPKVATYVPLIIFASLLFTFVSILIACIVYFVRKMKYPKPKKEKKEE